MYENILVSVVTCVYNTPQQYLTEAVKSILSQTHKNFEYFIVDDCSDSDLYKDEIFKDSRIKIIRLKENRGPSAARNAAFKKAKGKYIAIMDSDDISHNDRFEKQIAFMEEHPQVVALGSWFSQFGEKDNDVKRCIDDNEYYRCCLLFGNYPTLLNPSVMLRAKTLKDEKIVYDENLRKGEDYKMWVQLSKIGVCTNIHEILFDYRVHKNQTSQKLKTKDISPYDRVVMDEQYRALGLSLTKEEDAALWYDFRSDKVDPLIYKRILEKMLEANKQSRFFNQDKLALRICRQWEQKVYNIGVKNLFSLYSKLSKEEKKNLRKIEIKRIKQKITRAKADA